MDPNNPLEYLASLSPEQLRAALTPWQGQQGVFDERKEMLGQQMALAQALRDKSAGKHSTPVGAALGGISEVLNGVNGGMQMKGAMAGQQALIGERTKALGGMQDSAQSSLAAVLRKHRTGAQPGQPVMSSDGMELASLLGGR